MKVTRNIDTGDEKQTIRTISTKPKEHFEGRWKSGRLYPLYSVVVNNGTTFISQNAKMKEEPYVIYDADKKEFKAPDGWLIKEMSADSRVTALGGGGEGGVTPEEVEEMIKDKVDKVDGKGLSTNDYDDTEKNKVASAYKKPNNGIPKSDLAKAVQDVLDDADGAYKKPVTGIPFTDLADGVQDSLSNADEAKAGLAGKQDTISDLSAIRSGAAAGATSVQPAEFNELKDEVDTIGNGAYEEAWDGDSTPVVADIPAGVVVTYSSASYTGTLAASASTVDKIYLVSDGNGNYDRYTTVEANGAYSWKKVGSTAIPLSNYATKTKVNQLEAKVGELPSCVFNVNKYNNKADSYLSKSDARLAVPTALRYPGMVITYLLNDFWVTEQNKQLATSNWQYDAAWYLITPLRQNNCGIRFSFSPGRIKVESSGTSVVVTFTTAQTLTVKTLDIQAGISIAANTVYTIPNGYCLYANIISKTITVENGLKQDETMVLLAMCFNGYIIAGKLLDATQDYLNRANESSRILGETMQQAQKFWGTNNLVTHWNDRTALNPSGVAIESGDFKTSDFIPVNTGDVIYLHAMTGGTSQITIAGYSSNDESTFVPGALETTLSGRTDVVMRTIPSGVNYIRVAHRFSSYPNLDAGAWLCNFDDVPGRDILALNPKSEYDALVINAAKKNKIASNVPDVITFLHFSDIHGDADCTKRLMKMHERYAAYINDIICTGDMVMGNYDSANAMAFWNKSGAESVLMAIGNHDSWVTNYDASICEGYVQGLGLVKKTLVYQKFFAPYISGWGVTQPTDAEADGKCYYYKDYTFTSGGNTTKTLRLVVLDCMHYGVYTDLDNDNVSIQNTWLVGVLNDARTNNIPVIIADHFQAGNGNGHYVDCAYSSRDKLSEDLLNPLAYNAVQDFIDAGGEFVCWFFGHSHKDEISYPGGNEDQLQIAITCARSDSGNLDDGDRVIGTKTQDAFNVMSIDTTDKLIKIVRIGADRNRELGAKRVLVYRYADKDATHQRGLVYCGI